MMKFLKACHRPVRSTCLFLLSLVTLLTFATFVFYQPDVFYDVPRKAFYVYEFPNKELSFPTLFLANKKRLCIPDATVTVESGGRLGNVIMEYASTWSVARIYNLTSFVPQDIIYNLQDVFQPLSIPAPRGFLKTQTTCQNNRAWGKRAVDIIGTMKKIDMRKASLHNIVETAKKRHKLLVLERCVIMAETLVPLAGELRQEFRYRSKLETQAQKALTEIRNKLVKGTNQQVLFVGVHVRRTDYKDQIKLLYNATEEAGVDYYKRALSWMRTTLSEQASGRPVSIAFVVTSDDPTWCQEALIPALGSGNDSLGQYAVYWGGQGDISTPEQDLCLLSSCNHSIISYGTYGIWSALMAGGHTVVYDITGSEGNRHVKGYSPAMQFANNMNKWVAL